MKKKLVLALFCAVSISLSAQIDNNQFDQINRDVMLDNSNPRKVNPDSLGSDKEIPKGIKVWTVDKRFGDIVHSTPDTLSHMFMNSIFTTGLRGEFNTTGNLGAPRINRIFIDRSLDGNFIFTNPSIPVVTDLQARTILRLSLVSMLVSGLVSASILIIFMAVVIIPAKVRHTSTIRCMVLILATSIRRIF